MSFDDEEIDLTAQEMGGFGPHVHAEFRRRALWRAHRLRSKYVAALLIEFATALADLGRAVGAFFKRQRDARVDRQAIAKLHSLDDGALKDIGIRRSEIESIVYGHGADETRTRRTERLAA